MGVTVAIARVACETDAAPNLQDITTADLGGLTPKAALLIVTRATSDGAAVDNAVMSYGAATGASNEWVGGGTDEHNQGTTDTYYNWQNDACVYIMDPTDGSVDGEAEFSSFIENGVRINWVDEPASAYLLTVVLFAGTDLSAKAATVNVGNTVDLTTNEDTVGFEPDVLFTATWRNAPGIPGLTRFLQPGLVHWDGSSIVTQRCWSNFWRDDVDTSECRSIIREDYGVENYTDWYGEFSDFDADGFSVTTRLRGGNSSEVCYLALSFGGAVDSWVGTHTTPTDEGNDSEEGPGFTPQFVFMIPNLGEAKDVAYVDNRAGSVGFSTFDADDEYCSTISAEDAVATSNTQSLSDDRAITLPDDDGTLDIEATFVSFDANGWTVNYTNAPATAKLFPALAIGTEAAGDSYYKTLTDPIGVTDTLSLILEYRRSIDDTAAITDEVTTVRELIKNLADSVGITDTLTTALDKVISIADGIGITDLLTKIGTFFIRPDGDQSIGQWTDELGGTTNIYQSIDEPAPPIDSDYIQSPFAPQTQSYICTLSDALDPGLDTGHTLRYRYRKFPVTSQQVDLTVVLLQGVAELTSWNHINVASGWIIANQLISSGIVANITDYTDLRLEFKADVV